MVRDTVIKRSNLVPDAAVLDELWKIKKTQCLSERIESGSIRPEARHYRIVLVTQDQNIYGKHSAIVRLDLELIAKPPMSSSLIICSAIFIGTQFMLLLSSSDHGPSSFAQEAPSSWTW